MHISSNFGFGNVNSVIMTISASLIFGLLLFFLGATPKQRTGGKPSGYAVLTLDAAWPDVSIRERLAEAGLGTTIGESSQWVFLEDFGTLERVPLDSYRDRVESFDLRNDGYAERLSSFFVFQGKRRLFIPLRGAGDIDGRVRAALGDIPFSLTVLTPPAGPRSVVFPAILFTLAAAFTLLLSGEVSAFFLPLWAVLSGLGVPGFALAAVFAGLSRLLREPVRDYGMMRRYGTPSPLPLGPWVEALPQGILFLLAFAGITILGGLSPFSVILGFLFFMALLIFSLWAESYRGKRPWRTMRQGHIRFRPVPISGITRSLTGGMFSYARIMAPFTLAALVLLFVPAVLPGNAGIPSPAVSRDWTGWKSPLTVNAEVYREHVEFQRAFSFLPLGAPDKPSAYLRYSMAEDGLIDGAGSGESVGPGESVDSEIPSFPLAGLIDFLTNYTYTDPDYGSSGSLLIVLGLGAVLVFQDRRRPGKLTLYRDKRIAA
jgi:hypothetical protein